MALYLAEEQWLSICGVVEGQLLMPWLAVSSRLQAVMETVRLGKEIETDEILISRHVNSGDYEAALSFINNNYDQWIFNARRKKRQDRTRAEQSVHGAEVVERPYSLFPPPSWRSFRKRAVFKKWLSSRPRAAMMSHSPRLKKKKQKKKEVCTIFVPIISGG